MSATFLPIFALLLSVALLLTGNGLQGTLLPIRADIEAFSTFDIGVLGSSYFLGFAAGCVLASRLVRRAGHIRAFTAMVSIASAIALAHVLWPHPVIWWVLRALTGFCLAALYMIIESWLNERADNRTRGTIFAIYTTINLSVLTVGQLMITLYDPAGFPLFLLASILVSVAAVPIAVTRAPAPRPVEQVRIRIRHLLRMSPAGFAGCFSVGLANGSFWALGPVFARQSGADVAGVAFFMSATVIGGAVGQWPMGRLSDRFDRRLVIVAGCLAAALAGIGMVLLSGRFEYGLYAFGFLFGAFSFPVNAISIAHANDFAEEGAYVELASGLLLTYAVGAVIGPMVASAVMGGLGPAGLFAFTALVHVLLAGFVFARIRIRARPADELRGTFAEGLRATTTVAPIGPVAVDEVAGDDGAETAGEPSPPFKEGEGDERAPGGVE